MSDKFFVDTNVLIYAHDRSSGTKHDRARQLIERLWSAVPSLYQDIKGALAVRNLATLPEGLTVGLEGLLGLQ